MFIAILLLMSHLGWAQSIETEVKSPETEKFVFLRYNASGLYMNTQEFFFDVRIAKRLTLGANYSQMINYDMSKMDSRLVNTNLNDVVLGFQARYFLTGAADQSGFFFSPQFRWHQILFDQKFPPKMGGRMQTTLSAPSYSFLAGYQWMWNSGLNFNLGAGISRLQKPDKIQFTNSRGSQELPSGPYLKNMPDYTPNAEASLGLAF